MKALKPPSYTDQKGRVRDGFYPSPHNKITRPKPADASIPPLLIPAPQQDCWVSLSQYPQSLELTRGLTVPWASHRGSKLGMTT